MSVAPPTPRRPSPGERRARRERLSTWITLSVVAIICAVVGIGAFAMTNSWWVEDSPAPSADQQLPDGQSRFDSAGIDFLNRQRDATVDVTNPALARTLGLPVAGDTPIETLVPLTLHVRGETTVIDFVGVTWFTLTTLDDQVSAVTVVPASSSTWSAIRTDLAQRASSWGWSVEDLAALEEQVGDAGRIEGQTSTLGLPPTTVDGMTVSAQVTIAADGRITLEYIFAR